MNSICIYCSFCKTTGIWYWLNNTNSLYFDSNSPEFKVTVSPISLGNCSDSLFSCKNVVKFDKPILIDVNPYRFLYYSLKKREMRAWVTMLSITHKHARAHANRNARAGTHTHTRKHAHTHAHTKIPSL